jgi:molybdate transport system substrate-binding protein
VYAAASLSDVFRELGEAFTAQEGGGPVVFNFAGSQVLSMQIAAGASADVFASADWRSMRALEAGGHVRGATEFASNRLTVAVSVKSGGALRTFGDLMEARRVIVGARGTPVGAYTEQLFGSMRAQGQGGIADTLEGRIVSRETNVRHVRAKVALGEADVGIVYVTDVAGQEALRSIAIPGALEVSTPLTVGRVHGGRSAANRWINFLKSPQARAILRSHGFRVADGG